MFTLIKLLAFVLAAVFVGPTSAATVTLDMNGFPNATGGQVTGAGLERAIPLPAGKQQIELPNLKAGTTYNVDFFHNTGANSSDFSFTVSADGAGVASVEPAAKKFRMLKDFKPGATTLRLNTHTITYNANSGQTGQYWIHGLADSTAIKANSGPVKLVAVPGLYPVDNLYNTGQGNEDFSFVVDSAGKTSPGPGGGEYAQYSGSSVSPRAAAVHFKLTSTAPLSYHGSQAVREATIANNVYELDMPMTVGSSGLNIWSFGHSNVLKSNVVGPDGKPIQGTDGANDFQFCPRLRYDAKKGFYFQTTEGPADTVHAEVTGTADDGKTKFDVIASATIRNAPAEK